MNIGEKLEAFYLSFASSCEDEKHNSLLIEAMKDIEDHVPIVEQNEVSEIINEIIMDCRKRCAQKIRSRQVEQVRILIAATRKKLVSKAALDNEASQQHGQRHLNAFIDLLGSWSNIINEIHNLYLSKAMVYIVLSPLYTRISESAYECFNVFKQDKDLDQLIKKLINSVDKEEINLNTLDVLISQLSAFRDILNRYFKFIENIFDDERYDAIEEIQTTTSNTNYNLITIEELNKWTELDLFYTTFESFYLLQTIELISTNECTLLEIEENCYIAQFFEDLFFLFDRVVKRSFSTRSETCVFSTVNKIIEFLKFNSHENINVYSIVNNKLTFSNCIKNGCIFIKNYKNNNDKEEVDIKYELKTPIKSFKANSINNEINSLNNKNNINKKINNEISPSTSNKNLLISNNENIPVVNDDIKNVISFSNMNQWFLGIASPYIVQDDKNNDNDYNNSELHSNINNNVINLNGSNKINKNLNFNTPVDLNKQSKNNINNINNKNNINNNNIKKNEKNFAIDEYIFNMLTDNNDPYNKDNNNNNNININGKNENNENQSYNNDDYDTNLDYISSSIKSNLNFLLTDDDDNDLRNLNLKEEDFVVKINCITIVKNCITNLKNLIEKNMNNIVNFNSSFNHKKGGNNSMDILINVLISNFFIFSYLFFFFSK
jgi:hypothetical protein